MGDRLGLRGPLGFKRHLRVQVVPDDTTYLISDREIVPLDDERIAALAPLLDGSRTIAALAADPSHGLGTAELGSAIGSLLSSGLIRPFAGDDEASPGQDDRGASGSPRTDEGACPVRAAAAFWELAGADGDLARRALGTAHVRVIAVGDAERDLDATVAALIAMGTPAHAGRIGDPAASGPYAADGVTVVLVDDYAAPELVEVDAMLHAQGTTWLPLKTGGAAPTFGPVIGPDADAACFVCLRHAVLLNRSYEAPLATAGHPFPTRPRAELAATRSLTIHAAALAVAKWIAGVRRPDRRAVQAFDAVSEEWSRHAVRLRPHCPRCGDPELIRREAYAPVELREQGSRPDVRAMCAEQVLTRYGPLVSPLTGVVRDLIRDERCPGGMYLYVAPRPPAAFVRTAREIADERRSTSGGTGSTAVEAKAAALCEALERYSGQLHGEEVRIRASLTDLGPDGIDPNASMLFGAADHAEQARTDGTGRRTVPDTLDARTKIDWSPVWSLTADRLRYLPTAFLYTDCSPVPGVEPVVGGEYALAESNGCAAGGTLEEAVLHGFYELVERDAAGIWWYNRTRQPSVDLDAFDDLWLRDQRDHHAELGRELRVLDLTTDLAVPALVAVSRRVSGGSEQITFGFGADFSPARALRRAVSEVGQTQAFAVAESAGRLAGAGQQHRVEWLRSARAADHPYLMPCPNTPAHGPDAWSTPAPHTVTGAIEAARASLEDRGLEMLVHDRTRPDIDLPVVRVVVPGLRHFARRSAPGRLYDVPVALGRLAEPTRPGELNPITMIV